MQETILEIGRQYPSHRVVLIFSKNKFTFSSGAVTCEKKRKLALAIIEDFCACVKPLEQELERGIIHGDFNEQVFEAKMELQMPSKHDVLIH
jgi:hypothetical protein